MLLFYLKELTIDTASSSFLVFYYIFSYYNKTFSFLIWVLSLAHNLISSISNLLLLIWHRESQIKERERERERRKEMICIVQFIFILNNIASLSLSLSLSLACSVYFIFIVDANLYIFVLFVIHCCWGIFLTLIVLYWMLSVWYHQSHHLTFHSPLSPSVHLYFLSLSHIVDRVFLLSNIELELWASIRSKSSLLSRTLF